jgi:hypothetical protein
MEGYSHGCITSEAHVQTSIGIGDGGFRAHGQDDQFASCSEEISHMRDRLCALNKTTLRRSWTDICMQCVFLSSSIPITEPDTSTTEYDFEKRLAIRLSILLLSHSYAGIAMVPARHSLSMDAHGFCATCTDRLLLTT